jgi:DNA-binding transcriptional ArsR family regulator
MAINMKQMNSDLERMRTLKSLRLDHPTRLEIVKLLLERGDETLSPVQASKALDKTLGAVSYHFRYLADYRVVRVKRRTRSRGAFESHYLLMAPARARLEKALA